MENYLSKILLDTALLKGEKRSFTISLSPYIVFSQQHGGIPHSLFPTLSQPQIPKRLNAGRQDWTNQMPH